MNPYGQKAGRSDVWCQPRLGCICRSFQVDSLRNARHTASGLSRDSVVPLTKDAFTFGAIDLKQECAAALDKPVKSVGRLGKVPVECGLPLSPGDDNQAILRKVHGRHFGRFYRGGRIAKVESAEMATMDLSQYSLIVIP